MATRTAAAPAVPVIAPLAIKVSVMEFIYYPKCSTCQKAKKWLDDRGVVYEARHIIEASPQKEEMERYIQKTGKPIRKFFNTSGMLYRERGLKNKLDAMSYDEQLSELTSDPMLIKRPILVLPSGKILSGFREKEWLEALEEEH